MGAPKQKWTAEEEAALRAGVEKYGPGKWRAIQKDTKFGPCLTSRSNVDLKDKWRNMSVSANGLGSARERKSLALTATGPGLVTLIEDVVAATPLQSVSPDGVVDTKPLLLTSGPGHKGADRKSLGPRYDDIVVEAVLGLKDPKGSSNASIASYIEEHHPVPSNFRRLLTSKLKALAMQGKLTKVKQNYKVNTGNVSDTPSEGRPVKNTRPRRPEGGPPPPQPALAAAVGHATAADETRRTPRFPRDPAKTMRGAVGTKKPRIADAEFARTKMKTAEEAARAAVQAVAEAEQAAAAAEQAAREAEAAEAEAEAAEAAAEAAAAAIRPPKKFRAMALARGEEVSVKG